MPVSGFKGISYPFRVTSRGGVAMSTTSASEATHIQESIEQIFKTGFLERPMEGDNVYTSIYPLLFEPNNPALQEVLRSRMVDDLKRLETRIEVGSSDIDFEVETDDNGIEILYAMITYKVKIYQTTYTSKIDLGEVRT